MIGESLESGMSEEAARAYLRANGIERGMDARPAREIAETMMSTGSPALKGSTEIVPVNGEASMPIAIEEVLPTETGLGNTAGIGTNPQVQNMIIPPENREPSPYFHGTI